MPRFPGGRHTPGSAGPAAALSFSRLLRAASFLALASSLAAVPPPAVGQATRDAAGAPADLIVVADRVWTGDEARPWAEAVAVRDGRVQAVGSASEIASRRGPETRVLDRPGGFVAPGFIDNHTHFNRAGELLLGVNLLDVADEAALVRRVREADERLPEGAWLRGGDWGAYEDWALGSAGEEREAERERFRPHRRMIDSVTPHRPVLLSRWDRSAYLANGTALGAVGADCAWEGVECEAGEPTGRLTPEGARRVADHIPPVSTEQRMAEARAALARLAENGVTGIHDITPPAQMEIFRRLLAAGELTVRVYARPTLDRWEVLQAAGIGHGFGDDRLRVGGLKGFVDGIMGNSSARFYESYLTTGERGSWRTMMTEPPGMEALLAGADTAGHWPQVHAIGDQAIDTLLTMVERVVERNGERGGAWLPDGGRERRWRVIHTQVLRGPEVAERMAGLGLVAEVQPYHAIDDMRWMEERIGERARWAYAFRTLQEAGVRLSFGSDWPGTNASWYPARPMLGIYAAVTRQTLEGEPEGGWFPQERVDVETALRAYTVNNAWAEGQEDEKGSLAPGKLGDLVVLDADPFRIDPAALKDVEVLATVVGGQVVYRLEEPVRAGR